VGTGVDGNPTNLTVVDDWVFAEPQPTGNGFPIVSGAVNTTGVQPLVNATAQVPFTGVVATFTDSDPNGNAKDFTAVINWGDGHQTNGTITADGQGGFNVSGTNTFAHAGTFPISVDVADFGGGPGVGGSAPVQSITNTAQVATAPTAGIGVYDLATGQWLLRNELSSGGPDAGNFQYGGAGLIPVVGDWTGTGHSGIGVYDVATGEWLLRNSASPGAPDFSFVYGGAGLIPVTGDWNHTGHTGIGVFDPTTGTWLLRNEVSAGAPDAGNFVYGGPGMTPVTGDWMGSGHTGIGVYVDATGEWLLRNEVNAGAPDAGDFSFGGAGLVPVTADWNSSGHTGIGVYLVATGQWLLRNEVSAGGPDAGDFQYGGGAMLAPVTGTWESGSPLAKFGEAGVSNDLIISILTGRHNEMGLSL
jgi:hypothetical protein